MPDLSLKERAESWGLFAKSRKMAPRSWSRSWSTPRARTSASEVGRVDSRISGFVAGRSQRGVHRLCQTRVNQRDPNSANTCATVPRARKCPSNRLAKPLQYPRAERPTPCKPRRGRARAAPTKAPIHAVLWPRHQVLKAPARSP